MNDTDLRLVLGLEIHLHLKTDTKMFCRCSADIYDATPNTHTCPVCLGLPGALPVPNYDAIEKTQLLGLALNCNLNKDSKFDRKHYFYPDLPKGYQISQYKRPFCEGGFIELDSGKKMEIERIHLEEDTAKSFHQGGQTLIDFNKSGMPLVEIVTRPVFKSVDDAVEFCKKVQTTVRFLRIGDVDMEKGQMRLEANISLRTPEMEEKDELAKYKVEIKNINSFKFMEKAVLAEVERQKEILLSGGQVKQENRGYNEATGKTVSQRDKEEAHDYRYFPEPDIPPFEFDETHFKKLVTSMPELPGQLVTRLTTQYDIASNTASTLVYVFGAEVCAHFEDLVKMDLDSKKVANYLVNKKDYQGLTQDEFVSKYKEEDSKLTNQDELRNIVSEIVKNNAKAVTDFKAGNTASLEFLLGMVMRHTKGKADPTVTREILQKELAS